MGKMFGSVASTPTHTAGATIHSGQSTRARTLVITSAESPHNRPCHSANRNVTGVAAGTEKSANFTSSWLIQKKPQKTVMMPTSQP